MAYFEGMSDHDYAEQLEPGCSQQPDVSAPCPECGDDCGCCAPGCEACGAEWSDKVVEVAESGICDRCHAYECEPCITVPALTRMDLDLIVDGLVRLERSERIQKLVGLLRAGR